MGTEFHLKIGLNCQFSLAFLLMNSEIIDFLAYFYTRNKIFPPILAFHVVSKKRQVL